MGSRPTICAPKNTTTAQTDWYKDEMQYISRQTWHNYGHNKCGIIVVLP